MLILMCLISCLFGFANVQPIDQLQKQDNNVQYVESKSFRNRVKTPSGYYQYASTDLFSYDFLVGLIDYYVNDLGVSDLSYGSNNSVSEYIIQSNNIYSINYYIWQSKSYEHVYDVSNIVISKSVLDNSSFPVLQYDFIFSNASPYNYQFHLYWTAQRTDNFHLTIWGVQIGVSNDLNNLHTQSSWYSVFMVEERINGMQSFIGNVFNTIYSDEYNSGYTQGYNDAYGIGYAGGYNVGHNEGYYEGEVYGYQQGYTNGVNDTQVIGEGTQASIIFGGILDVAFIPVNVFLLMFQYEVFGINIAGLVSGLITVALIIILIRVITGKKLW